MAGWRLTIRGWREFTRDHCMLLLKLFLVPAFLVAITLVGQRWGAAWAGWLAGLPVVAGPILYFLALEQGPAFAATAAAASLAAVLASVTFNLAYALAASRLDWCTTLPLALLAWLVAAVLLSVVPGLASVGALIALVALILAPRAFPSAIPDSHPAERRPRLVELALRAVVGAGLTLVVTLLASKLGARWSGLLTVFPVLGIVLAVFTHRLQGAAFTATLLRTMVTGLYAFAAFCLALALLLERTGLPVAFGLSVFASLAVQLVTRRNVISQLRKVAAG